jgi:L-asparaginase II
MSSSPYLPLFELTRGRVVESIHFGAIAVVDACERIVASYGDPQAVTFLRSTAKPFQALPFIENDGHKQFSLSLREIALMCASHSGTDEHVAVVQGMQAKTGVAEADLQCGVHPISHEPTLEAMLKRGEKLSPNRHNCSGKHTGMLAYARMKGLPKEDYTDPSHPIQQEILQAFAAMCALPPEQVEIGIDGCSAPNFAVPLYNAALALARLSDPQAGNVRPHARQVACETIFEAMTSHPDMVGGPDSFDTHLMQAMGGQVLAKSGAEGYCGLGLPPGALSAGSPGVGVALKISDGDSKHRARPAVILEILRQLGVIDASQLDRLADFGPVSTVRNWRKLDVGEARPCFVLSR